MLNGENIKIVRRQRREHNTIKFKNYSGALTDAGGTNNLTEEEIAVATAKGWTVTLV